jgi:hypothetical protein
MTTNPYPAEVLDQVTVAYAGDEERPLGSFLALMGLYGGLAAGLGATAVRKGLPERVAVPDMVLLGVATAKLSRLLSRDRVTSPLRAPVTQFEEFGEHGEVEESPRGSGFRRGLGELVTCPYCVSQWVGTALLGAFLVKPRETRVVSSLFGLLTVSDLVQVGHEHLMA